MTRALVIGVGRQGSRHRRVLEGLGFRVDTLDPVAADATYADFDEAAGNDYAAVAVAVPIRVLTRVAIEALFEFAPERMLVEKPLGVSVEEVETLDEASRATDTLIVAGYTERFNPALRQFEAMLEDGDRGEIRHITARRYSPDGGAPDVDPILDLGVHDIDAAIRLGPGSVVHIDAGYAPYRTRTFVAVHDDGVATFLDLANRLVDNVAIDGPEPLVALWESVLAEDPGYRSLEHEIDVVRAAEFLIAGELEREEPLTD